MKSQKSFAAAYQDLEAITKEFEAGELDLEIAISKFKEAVNLVKILKADLAKMEAEIETINLELANGLKEPVMDDQKQEETSLEADENLEIPF